MDAAFGENNHFPQSVAFRRHSVTEFLSPTAAIE